MYPSIIIPYVTGFIHSEYRRRDLNVKNFDQ